MRVPAIRYIYVFAHTLVTPKSWPNRCSREGGGDLNGPFSGGRAFLGAPREHPIMASKLGAVLRHPLSNDLRSPSLHSRDLSRYDRFWAKIHMLTIDQAICFPCVAANESVSPPLPICAASLIIGSLFRRGPDMLRFLATGGTRENR